MKLDCSSDTDSSSETESSSENAYSSSAENSDNVTFFRWQVAEKKITKPKVMLRSKTQSNSSDHRRV